MTVAVYLENLVVKVTLESPAHPVVLEHLDHLASLVVHQESATNQQTHHADNAHLETLETLDHLENLETVDVLAILADLAMMDHLDRPVLLDHPDLEVTLAEMDHLDNLAVPLKVNP